MGVDSSTITAEGKRQWPTTTFDVLALTTMTLFRALRLAPELEWPKFWMAGLVDKHVIVASGAGALYLVVGVTRWLILRWELETTHDENVCRLVMRADALSEATVTSLEEYVVYTY
eukprot:2331997-Pyramimonas_sp.AAC.1